EGLFSPEVTGIFDINGIQKIVLLSEYCANTENAEYNYELIFIDPKTEKVEYHHIPHADIMIAISNYENMLYYLCKENSGECTLYSLTLGSSVSKKLLSLKCNTEITYTTIAVDNTGKEILFSMDNRLYLYNVLKNKIAWEKDLSDYKLSGIITYQWSINSKLFWVVSEENISFFDSNGSEKYRIPATLLDDAETINILKEDCCFWNGKEYCYYLYSDLESNTTTLYKISLSDASIMEAVTISTQDGIASLEYMNDTLLMIFVSNQTVLVDIADENLEIRALLPYIDWYDKINNRFYIRTMLDEQIEEIGDTNNYTGSHEYEWGYFPRHSIQELLEIGKSIIKNY
ncbi:MAG: hypothetical protein Q4F21_03120, partial [Lachnospiraceae bacterium]|nr:hypothetical protein [Lachnospiraceae bacterium]